MNQSKISLFGGVMAAALAIMVVATAVAFLGFGEIANATEKSTPSLNATYTTSFLVADAPVAGVSATSVATIDESTSAPAEDVAVRLRNWQYTGGGFPPSRGN